MLNDTNEVVGGSQQNPDYAKLYQRNDLICFYE